MANTNVFIPDGMFCSDKYHLDCKFSSYSADFCFCNLYGVALNPLESFKSNGELRRARRKCTECLRHLKDDTGSGFIIDKE